MSGHKTYDLTEGGILRKLLLVAIPIMGTSFMQMAYNLTDMFWLGQGVSSEAVAASGASGMYLWLSMALLLIGRLGAEIGVSQNFGRRDYAAAQGYAQNSFLWAVALGVGYGLLMILFNKPLISVFGMKEEGLVSSAATYLSVVGIGIPFTYVSASITGMFNGSGNSRLSFWANAVGLVLNMILDPLFIFVAGMGIIGAAVATVLAQMIVCALFVVFLKKHRARPFPSFKFWVKPDRPKALQIVRWSALTALESMLFTLLAMATTRLVASFGGNAVAVQRVGAQIESLSWLIGGGFGTAVTSFVGQNYGAGKWTRIHRGFRISLLAMTIWGVIITVLLFFGGRLLYSVFVRETVIQDMGDVYLKILALCQIATCFESVAGGAFRGMGKTMPPAVASIASNVLRVPLAYLLASTSLGLNGAWWGISITAAMRGVIILIWYLWRARRMPKRDEEPVHAQLAAEAEGNLLAEAPIMP